MKDGEERQRKARRNERRRNENGNDGKTEKDGSWAAWAENWSPEARRAGFLKETLREPSQLGDAEIVEYRKWTHFRHLPLFEIKDGEKRRRKKTPEYKDGDLKRRQSFSFRQSFISNVGY